ncbi:MAG: efflux RND transporter periplasmic adaptor subunit [Acidobacteria bacterium]|nr:efflux RND transporter periplasmic adaptor subunit [Acidobacteriota bacterium]
MRAFRSQAMVLSSLAVLAASSWRCGQRGNTGTANTAPAPVVLAVRAQTVSPQDWTVTIPISGSLRSRSIVDAKPEVGGRLVAAYFEEGDLVRRNQVIAEIDPTNYRLALDQAKAALAVAEAGLQRARVASDHARREKERADNLLSSGGITQKDHEAAVTGVRDADAQVRLAEAQREQARATLAIAEKALSDCRILAPADGHVQKKYLDRGSLISPGVPVYKIVDNSSLELECVVPSHRLGELRVGQASEFTTPAFADRGFRGVVAAVSPMVEEDSRSVRVILRITNPTGELRSGMYARGAIIVRAEKNALVVPRSALLVEGGESSSGVAYTVREGRARRRPVQLGGIQEDRVWIREGLQPGDIVIVEIGPDLKDGSLVRVQPGPLEGH